MLLYGPRGTEAPALPENCFLAPIPTNLFDTFLLTSLATNVPTECRKISVRSVRTTVLYPTHITVAPPVVAMHGRLVE